MVEIADHALGDGRPAEKAERFAEVGGVPVGAAGLDAGRAEALAIAGDDIDAGAAVDGAGGEILLSGDGG